MVTVTDQKPTLKMIDSTDSKPIAEWERLYPDLWLFIEVTNEDEWEPYEGRLVCTAKESLEFVEIAKSYHERGVSNLTTRGDYTEPQPAL
ncbi:MAG TPA: hypothetical protein VG778_05115, partial [Blastocatellia bacterium]|nr:hypothetical protein [Blastocatellia bacterium]